jgi:hypothetical protein
MKKEDLDKAVFQGHENSAVATIDLAITAMKEGRTDDALKHMRSALLTAEEARDERNKLAKALLVAKDAMRGNAMRYISRAERLHVEDACELAMDGDVQYLNVHGVSLTNPFKNSEGQSIIDTDRQQTDTEAVAYWVLEASVDKAVMADACRRWRTLNQL